MLQQQIFLSADSKEDISARVGSVASIVVVESLSFSFHSVARLVDTHGVKIDELTASPCD